MSELEKSDLNGANLNGDKAAVDGVGYGKLGATVETAHTAAERGHAATDEYGEFGFKTVLILTFR